MKTVGSVSRQSFKTDVFHMGVNYNVLFPLVYVDIFPYWKDKEVAKGNLRRDMYLHRFSKVPVHAVQTYLIIRWAVTESSA